MLQLLLRCQVQAVQRLWAIGDELERVVRDLWAVVSEDAERASTEGTSARDDLSAPQPDAQKSKDASLRSSTSDSDSESRSNSTNTTESTSTTDTDTDSSAIPQDLLDKLSSSPPSSPTRHGNVLPPPPIRRPGRKPLPSSWRHGTSRSRITATTVLRVLVLGLWMIRVPVMVVDVIREVERGGIPYLAWRVEGLRGGWRGGMARVSVRTAERVVLGVKRDAHGRERCRTYWMTSAKAIMRTDRIRRLDDGLANLARVDIPPLIQLTNPSPAASTLGAALLPLHRRPR